MANLDPRVNKEDVEAMTDYRRMLYRLDLARSFRSADALLLHFMGETLVDGFIEIRVYSVYSNSDPPVDSCPTPSARLSFKRDAVTGVVVADRLFKPTESSYEKTPNNLYKQQYIVAKTYPARTLLLDAFNPIVQPLLTGNKSTLVFEYRAFLDGPPGASDEFEIVTRQMPHKLMVGPQLIESIPNRFQSLEGKTIAIDGTLITQRLHFTPDPRPHRHVLGWYQLVQELRQNNIKVICVFDGKYRIPAKRYEVERRKLMRMQALARGTWEKSRHERLLSLTHALRKLEKLPENIREEVLKGVQVDSQLSPLVYNPSTQGSLTGGLVESTQPNVDDAKFPDSKLILERLSSRGEPEPTERSEQLRTLDPLNTPLEKATDISKHTCEEKEPKAEPFHAGETIETTQVTGSSEFATLDGSVLENDTTAIQAGDTRAQQLDREPSTLELDSQVIAQPSDLKTDPGFQDTLIPTINTSSINGNVKLPDPWTLPGQSYLDQTVKAGITANRLPVGDHKTLIHKILNLYDHYSRTTVCGPNGTIHTSTNALDTQDTPVVPISRNQQKYIQEESELWNEIIASTDGTTANVARVVEMAEQFASITHSDDDVPREQESEDEPNAISERSARLEEQSNLMAASLTRRASPPTALNYAESRLILEAMGIPCIESSTPYEAEAFACSLVLNGLADLVGSEDTDVLMYNAPLLRNMTDRKVPLQIIPTSVETGLGLSRAAFVDLAILMGTDFTRRIKKIGPNTAWRLMHTHGSIERMLEEEPKFRPPDVADYLEQVKVARKIFNSVPPAPSLESISRGSWDEQAVFGIMSRFGLQRYLQEDTVLPDALAGNYYLE